MTHSVGTGFLCEASPKWLRSRKCHLLGKRREFLGLLGQRRKVLLCKFGRKFHKLRRRLHDTVREKLANVRHHFAHLPMPFSGTLPNLIFEVRL
jgi:hypothetical protein